MTVPAKRILRRKFPWGGFLQGAMGGAGTGAAFGPPGIAVGALLGGVGGHLQQKQQMRGPDMAAQNLSPVELPTSTMASQGQYAFGGAMGSGDPDPEPSVLDRVKASVNQNIEHIQGNPDLSPEERISRMRSLYTSLRNAEKMHGDTPPSTQDEPAGQVGMQEYFQNRLQEAPKQVQTEPWYKQLFAKGGALGGTRPLGNSREDAVEFQGARHEEGGINLPTGQEVEGGETMDRVPTTEGESDYVFSDRLQVPGTAFTFAEYHKGLVEKNGELSQEDLQKLASLQEEVAGRSSGGEKLNTGGKVGYRAPDQFSVSPSIPGSINPNVPVGHALQPTGGGGPNIGQIAAGVAPYAGAIMNVGMGAFGPSSTQRAKTQRVDRSALRHLKDMPTEVNVRPQEREITRSERAITSNPAASAGERLTARGQSLKARERLQAQKENQEAQLRGNRGRSLARLEGRMAARDAQAENRADARYADAQMREAAARESMVMSGVQGAAQTYQMQQLEDAQLEQQEVAQLIELAKAHPDSLEMLLPIFKKMGIDPSQINR